MDVVVWLRGLDLGRYGAAFRENDIDETVLSGLTHENLKELGVTSLGHRLKLLNSVAALRTDAEVKGPSADPAIAPSAPKRLSRRPRRAPSSHSDVLRLGRLNATIGAHGP